MGTIIGSVISIAVSAALILVFRMLDSDNRSIDKVKKYSDVIEKKLKDFFDTRTKMLTELSAELETNQQRALAEIKRLEGLRTDFLNSSSGLDAKLKDLANIEKQIAEYNETIQNLVGMTMRAEENLKLVEKDAKHWDARYKSIDEMTKNVDKLSARIPEISASVNPLRLSRICAY